MTTDNNKIFPIFKDNYIPIIFATDNNFVPYLFVAINSIIQNNNSNSNLDFIIFYTQISDYNKEKFKTLNSSNVNIRFFDMTNLIEEHKEHWYIHWNYTEAIYYRFFVPQIFQDYEKVLYLDADIVTNIDIKELYEQNIGSNYVAAARDFSIRNKKSPAFNSPIYKYINKENYFNSGVLLFNLREIKNFNFFEKCIDILQELKTPIFPDQDVLNVICKDKVFYLKFEYNMTWNIMHWYKNTSKILNDIDLNHYQQALITPKILHFNGVYKPWESPWLDYADIFWKYARKTPFYETILFKGNMKNINKITFNKGTIKNIVCRKQIYWHYLRCRILGLLTFGKKQTHYQTKQNLYKKQVQDYRKALK